MPAATQPHGDQQSQRIRAHGRCVLPKILWQLLPDVLRDVCGADVSKCFESCQRVGSLREACVSVSRGYVDLRQGDVAE